MGSLLRSSLIFSSGIILLGSAAFAQADNKPASSYLVDLSKNHWCYACSTDIVDKYQVLSGYQDHTYRGDWDVNRYTLAAAVARSFEYIQMQFGLDVYPEVTRKVPNIGIPSDHWAYSYVYQLAIKNDLLSQLFSDNQFNGEQVVTRKEMAYAISEFMVYLERKSGKQLIPERRQSQLAIDLEQRSPFNDYIELALNRYQFMNLYEDHTFRPEEAVTRYDISASLCKIFKIFEDLN